MENIDIACGVIFQKMGIYKDPFDDEFICQKKIYLLESLGTDLGYTYIWYVRGPYSPSLANYLYNNLENLRAKVFSHYSLSESAGKNVERVNSLSEAKKQDMSVESWYELLASLVYIYNNKQSWKIDDKKESLFDILIKYKPQYNMEQCQYSYDILCDQEFIGVLF